MKDFMTIKNDYYEVYFPKKYENDIKEVLDYSTKKLKENLLFFKESSYGKIIKASFFDKKEDFFAKIYEFDNNANPSKLAEAYFYGEEIQILLKEGNVKLRFLTLAHETCHLLFTKFIYENYYHGRVVWLDESFAANFSGEIKQEISDGTFVEYVKKYLNKENLPNLNDISFKKNNIKTKEYDAYDFFYIVGRYLVETNSKEELLKLYKNEEKVLQIGNHILNDSLNYFKETLIENKKILKGEILYMSEEKQNLSKETTASDNVVAIIDKYNNGELSNGEYAHKLITETYINLISQSQSGAVLCIEGQMLDIKIGMSRRIPNTNKFITGYRLGNFAVNYEQDTPAVGCSYNQDANLMITKDGFLIEEQLDNPNNQIGTIIYNGKFKNVTKEGLNVLEKCLKFSALNYDLYLDKDLLKAFSKNIKLYGESLNDLPLLEDERKHNL